MAAGTPKTALEQVARLEVENAELRTRIAQIRAEEALEETVATRRAPRPADAMPRPVVVLLIGILSGLSFAVLSTRVSGHVREMRAEPPPVVEAPPPTAPPVHPLETPSGDPR